MMKNILLKIRTILGNKHGNMFPITVAVAIVMLMLILVVCEYMKMMILCGGIKDAYEEAMISVVNDNYNEVYHCVREGYAAGYEPTGEESFYSSIDTGDVDGRLVGLLGLTKSGSEYNKLDTTNSVEYSISNINVSVHNAPMVRTGEKFYAEGTLLLKIPVRLGGKIIINLPVNIRVKAQLDEVF